MTLNERFCAAVRPLLNPGMGTEHVAPLLYSWLRMTKPHTCLEIGRGYTTPFLAQALEDNRAESAADAALLRAPTSTDAARSRASILLPDYHQTELAIGHLISVDDESQRKGLSPSVADTLATLGLAERVTLVQADFRSATRGKLGTVEDIDFVWFDCGGPAEAVTAINQLWPRVSDDHGVLALHYTYFRFEDRGGLEPINHLVATPLLNELKKRQAQAPNAFELMSLLEPNKQHQGSLTLLRKLPWNSRMRSAPLADEHARFFQLETPALRFP